MKKTIILLIVAALCTIGASAKTIHIWHNGVKTDLPIQTNDSITFDEGGTPIMHIWRNGAEIYQLTLAVEDSITYSQAAPQPQADICFNYEHWRDVDTVTIYEFHDHVWQTIALPWADVVTTTIPDYYRFPNLESHIDTLTNDTVPTWQLAFNTCHNSTLDGVHMFGLWNEKSNIMRIYSYLEELPNPNAAYCFYRVESSSPAFIDRDAMTWMPSESVLHNNWNTGALAGLASAPSTQICDLMPFASLKPDGSEAFAPVFAGWVAFDLPLCTGTFSVPQGGNIKFYLEAVQHINAIGTVDFNMALAGKGTGTGTGTSTSTGKITIPGNDNKKTAGWLTSWGSFASGIGSAATSAVSSGNAAKGGWLGIVGGIAQGIGSCLSLIGNVMNAQEEAKDKKLDLAFTTDNNMNYNLDFNFNGTITGQFDAQLTSTLASTAKPLTISYDKFFEGILAHPNTNHAPKARTNEGDSNGESDGIKFSLGVWNLKRQPRYYVREECAQIGEDRVLISYLDPTSIELELNMDNPFFDANEIDSIKLVAYDYAFVDSSYHLSAEPYYYFYGIQLDSVHIKGIRDTINHHHDYTDYLLDQSAAYKTITKGDRAYVGVASDSLAAYGFGMYNMVYSPAIRVRPDVGRGTTLMVNEISVAVIVEMTFKNGEKRIFAERYLPEIITYHYAGPFEIGKATAPTSINGIPLECPLFDMQKAKVLRFLPD